MNDAEKQEKLLRMMEEEQNQIRNSTVNQKNPEQLQESLPHSTPKLIKCSDCGREVSTRARECPHCGSPVDIKYQKEELKRKIDQEKKGLIDEKKLLEKKLANLKTETDSAWNHKFGMGCLVYFVVIFSLSVGLVKWFHASFFDAVGVGVVVGLPCCIFLSVIGFFNLFVSKENREQFDELKVSESRLEENKKESEKLVDNLKNINSPKVFATLAAGYGLHQMRGIRQELGEINESIADGGGDASGGDGGGGEADFSSFM